MLPALVLMLSGVPDTALFGKARTVMAETLAKQSNYVCLETIDRSQRPSRKARFARVDSVRVEVAFIGKRELYSWPGAKKFEKDLLELVSDDGAISTGAFAGHAQSLINVQITDVGSGEWILKDGKRRARFPFTVPASRSHYMVMKTRAYGVLVQYSGEIWVDPETGRVLRLKLRTESIPEVIGIASTQTEIEYGAIAIGAKEFWLPLRSTDSVVSRTGFADNNLISLTACRQFTGESKVSFGEGAPDSRDSGSALTLVELPPGIAFDVRFTQAVNFNALHVGDLIPASLGSEIKQNDTGLFAEGSAVEMRLIRFRKRKGQAAMSMTIGEVNSSNATARLSAVPDAGVSQRAFWNQRGGTLATGFEIGRDIDRLSLGTIYMRGSLQLPKGYRTSWVTTALSQVPKEERH